LFVLRIPNTTNPSAQRGVYQILDVATSDRVLHVGNRIHDARVHIRENLNAVERVNIILHGLQNVRHIRKKTHASQLALKLKTATAISRAVDYTKQVVDVRNIIHIDDIIAEFASTGTQETKGNLEHFCYLFESINL
jgi:hypothetical protein